MSQRQHQLPTNKIQVGLKNLKTQQYHEPSICHSRALSKCSHQSNPQEILNHFQTYISQAQDFQIQKLHNSPNLKLKKYKQSIYYGQFVDNKRSGKGIMMYNNSRLYQGQWLNDQKEGIGYQLFPNGCIYKGSYKQGKPYGLGKYTYQTGQHYQGEWKNGLKHGSGMWRGHKGDSYIGQWKIGKPDGYGVHTWINGDKYEGQFKQCLKHGEGIQKFANGDIYKGSYEAGKPEGFGEYFWSNSSYFKGSFSRGLRNGNGIWKRAQGISDKYQGEYVNDRKCGYGIFTWASGNVYKGNYLQDTRNGYGQMYWIDGSIYRGQWKEGIQHGEGEIYVPKQGKRKGIFENNIMIHVQDQQLETNSNPNKWSLGKTNHYSVNPTPKYTTKTNNKFQIKQKFSISKPKNLEKINQRMVIDISNNKKYALNHPLIPSKYKNKTRDSIEKKSLKSSRQRLLHSSFYLHKLHTRNSTNLNDSLSRQCNTSFQKRKRNQLASEIKNFTKMKMSTFQNNGKKQINSLSHYD